VRVSDTMMMNAMLGAWLVAVAAGAANVVDIKVDTMVRPITIQNPTPR
jgi:hypothetical protein